jgi:hypothetical protein
MICAELAAILSMDAVEARQIAEVLAWVDSGAELCRIAKPATSPRHLAAYFVLTDNDWVLLEDHIRSGIRPACGTGRKPHRNSPPLNYRRTGRRG